MWSLASIVASLGRFAGRDNSAKTDCPDNRSFDVPPRGLKPSKGEFTVSTVADSKRPL
jgi:hypothetical protein